MFFRAYNTKSKVLVNWLGCTDTKLKMNERLKKYDAPKYMKPKKVKVCVIKRG